MSNHLLVVEDDKDLRETLSDALELEGYEVDCAENGEVALRHLQTGGRPCVILLDLMMPVMDGWTFRRELLKEPSLSSIPVVVMTAAVGANVDAIEADGVLRKPLHIDAVIAVVQRHCPGAAGG